MSGIVAFVSHHGYETKPLMVSIGRVIDISGFDLSHVRGKKVLLKPNMLGAYPVESGTTTHPAFVRAVAEVFISAGACVSIGDSPNGVHALGRVWDVTGMRDACRATGAKEARFEESGNCERNGVRLARAVTDADIVVNLPKFKTHGLTILTLAVKNLFGCVNGMQKTRFHRDYNSTSAFADIIVKIADAVNPALTIIDGIVAMDGNGPSAGRPVDLGVMAAGTNIHSLDAACCGLIGLEPQNLDTLSAARRLGLWDPDAEVKIAGDPIEKLRPSVFELPSTYTKDMRNWRVSRFVLERIWSGLSAQPKIDPKLCEKCGMCVKACPVNAIEDGLSEAAPVIQKKSCIQCMCCHEICPHRAIDLKRSPALKIARWLADRQNKRSHFRDKLKADGG